MLSIPVADLAMPLYPLAQEGFNRTHLLGWLLAVGLLWAYIGWRFDNWGQRLRVKSPYRQIIGTLLVLFAAIVVIDAIGMFHVGLLYRAISFVWAGVILQHAFQFYRPSKSSLVDGGSPANAR